MATGHLVTIAKAGLRRFIAGMELQRHPGSPPSPVERIEALAVHLPDGKFSLVFTLLGDVERVLLPPPGEPVRRDGLWRSTCLEAFVRPPREDFYFELNFAPGGGWAAYRFDSYRSGMKPLDVPPPIISSVRGTTHYGLVAGIDLAAEFELAPWETWLGGLSAVIEADDGSLSYWALAHPAGKPDFHHPDCFTLELPPPSEP
jgi:hypothetical protein